MVLPQRAVKAEEEETAPTRAELTKSLDAMRVLLRTLQEETKLHGEIVESIDEVRQQIQDMQPLARRHKNTLAFVERKKSRLIVVDVEMTRLEAEKSILVDIIKNNARIIEKLEEEMATSGLILEDSDDDLAALAKEIGAVEGPKVRAALLRYKTSRKAVHHPMDEDSEEDAGGTATPVAEDGYGHLEPSDAEEALATPVKSASAKSRLSGIKTCPGGVKATIGKQQIRLFGRARRRCDEMAEDGNSEGCPEYAAGVLALCRDP
jgi:hypothetical protein